jgi:hypothetical protein
MPMGSGLTVCGSDNENQQIAFGRCTHFNLRFPFVVCPKRQTLTRGYQTLFKGVDYQSSLGTIFTVDFFCHVLRARLVSRSILGNKLATFKSMQRQ